MKRHRDHFTRRLGPATTARLNEALLAQQESLRDVYARFGLQGAPAKISIDALEKYARELRAQRPVGGNPETEPGAASASRVQSLLESALQAMQEALDARTLKGTALAATLRSISDLSRLTFDEEANRRANELHALKVAELRETQTAALETVSKAAQLTAEQVAEIRAKVLGL